MNKSIKFEDLLNELEALVKDLENGDLNLDDAVNKYKRGIEIANECKKILDQAQSEVDQKMNEGKEDIKDK